jgi:predicted transcriptional regulator
LHTIDFRTLIYEAYKSRALEKGEKTPSRSTLKRAYDRFQELRESASARRAVMQKDAENLHVSKLKELRTAFIQPYETAS